jgi:2-methylisocitrate lyase-like PEP mutase family enzyme
MEHSRSIVAAVDVPVAADLENGFGDDPAFVADTIQRAADAGLVGGSIEDANPANTRPIYDLTLATERIAAAAEAARKLPFPFTLTARAENFVRGNPDLNDTINRLVAYANAGADVLFAPALPDIASVRAICSAVPKPVNFMVGIRGKSFSISELAAAGVKRISFASSLYRAAMTHLVNIASALKNEESLAYLDSTLVTAEINKYLGE